MAETKIVASRISDTIEFTFSELALGNGSAAAPSIAFANDQDTGWYGLADNSMRLSIGGSQRYIFDSSTLVVVSDSAKVSMQRSSNGRTAYTSVNNVFGGIELHGGPNGGAELANVSHIFTCDAPSVGTTQAQILANGQFQFLDGSNTTPVMSFLGDTDTGIYRITSDTIGIVTGGLARWRIENDRIRAVAGTGVITHGDGTIALPSISFENDNDTGIFRGGANRIDFSNGGVNTYTITSAGLFGAGPVTSAFHQADGSAALPSYSFVNDTNLGLYRIGTDEMGVAAAGGNLLFRFGFAGGLQTLFRGGTSAGLPGLALGEASSVGFYRITGLDIMGISAPMAFQSGTSSNPSVTFAGDENTGIYRIGADDIGFAAAGVEYLRVGVTGAHGAIHSGAVGGFSNVINSPGNVAIYYAHHTDNTNTNSHAVVSLLTGGTNSGDPKVTFEVNGITGWSCGIDNSDSDIFVIDNSSTTLSGGGQFAITPNATAQIIGQDGTVSLPYYSFYNDQDCGMYRSSTNEVSFAAAGQLAIRYHGSHIAFYTQGQERWGINSAGNMTPNLDNAYSLGQSGLRTSSVWSANGTIQTSHSTTKQNIEELDWEALEIPAGVMYDRDGRRWLGYLNDSLPNEGRPVDENGEICPKDNYEQAVIGVLCAVVKGLKSEVAALKAKLGE